MRLYCTVFSRIESLLDLLMQLPESLSSENVVLLNAGVQRLALRHLHAHIGKLAGSADG